MHHSIRGLNVITMNNNWKRSIIGSTLLIVLLSLFFIRFPVIVLEGEKHTLYLKEDRFILRWIHSVEKEEWLEEYVRDGQDLILTKTSFKTFGAGTPYTGEEVSTENGMVQMEIHVRYPDLLITVSSNVETTLMVDNRTIPLYTHFRDFEAVRIRVHYLQIWDFLEVNSL